MSFFEYPKEDPKLEKNRRTSQDEALQKLLEEIDAAAAKIRTYSKEDDFDSLMRELKNKTLEENIYLISEILEESIRAVQEQNETIPASVQQELEHARSIALELERLVPHHFAVQETIEVNPQAISAAEPSWQAKTLSCVKGHILDLLDKAEGKADKKTIKQIEDAYWRTVGLIDDIEKKEDIPLGLAA